MFSAVNNKEDAKHEESDKYKRRADWERGGLHDIVYFTQIMLLVPHTGIPLMSLKSTMYPSTVLHHKTIYMLHTVHVVHS